MRFINKLLSNLPFFTYSKKVDPVLRSALRNDKLKYLPLVLVFGRKPDQAMENKVKRLGFKKEHTLPFIKSLSGKMPLKNFDHLVSILELEKIYFDGKVHLMGTVELPDTKHEDVADVLKPLGFGGKGISAAFIDSGIYPHPDFTRPKNRILAFMDFINEYEYPYDDNGHGTACIGTGFGAAADGKFRALAYDAGLVCAKAFNKFGVGDISDILAAMQWILDMREKHNIKVAVMPFGTPASSQSFDVLGLAVRSMWQQGVFVCTCAGNLGPQEGSITSPGSCEYSFTAAACEKRDGAFRHAGFSGCGPVAGKTDKPDVIMPGVNIDTLNAVIDFVPKNKTYYSNMPQQAILYKQFSGTSASASLAAASAVLLYQIKPELAPDDIKSILKKCSVSINELKNAQGAGIIDLKKLEQLKDDSSKKATKPTV